MAGTSPRRSNRSRTAQPPNSGSHYSSASSNSSGRAERNTRTSNKAGSPQKSTPSASLSSEPPDESIELTADDSLQTRRRKRVQTEDREKPPKDETIEMTNGDEIVEDDEAVRCICGNDEYPGPPQLQEEDGKKGIKDAGDLELITEADYTEDLAGFFLQCDVCKVWQHGGCVGIKNEDMSPEEYFCEVCRKDLHKIFTGSNGQKYSHYLPLYQTLSRTTSRAASFSKDGTRSPKGSKNGRPSSSIQGAKRRSTMNSRDAAYDEEEQFRRAIEASKGEKSGGSTDGGTRRGKRGRSDSEEKQEASKRQRTASNSPALSNDPAQFVQQNNSDDGANARNGGVKKIRGTAARNHKEKDLRDEKGKIRAEAASKRKHRADRRRVDDSDPPEETPPASKISPNKPLESTTQPPEPPSSQVAAPDTSPAPTPLPSTSHKKGGRPPHGRKGKVGKNQYTRDRDQNEGDDQSPSRSQSRDVGRGEENGHSNHRTNNNDGKQGRFKGNSGSKVTMLEMKKKVAAMLEFISRTQIELATESLTPGTGEVAEKMMSLAGSILPAIQANGENGKDETAAEPEKTPEKDFKDLTLLGMMDELTRQLIKWQNQFV